MLTSTYDNIFFMNAAYLAGFANLETISSSSFDANSAANMKKYGAQVF